MKSRSYRSYVVRVRSAATADAAPPLVRLDVEDLIDGGRAAIDGDEARTVADTLQAVVDNGRQHSDHRASQATRVHKT